MIKKTIYVFYTIFLSLLFTACSPSNDLNREVEDNGDRLTIYTTLFPLEDFTRKIGGRYVQVENIISPGTDPHTYEPTSKTIVRIARGDAFIYSGAGLEGYAKTISNAMNTEQVQILEAAQGITAIGHIHENHKAYPVNGNPIESDQHEEEEEHGHAHEEEKEHGHSHGEVDPHVWLDPIRSIYIANNIKETLIHLKPEGKQYFEENFQALKQNLIHLDEAFHKTLQSVKHKEVFVSHAAYGYWEQAYGIEQVAISGINRNSELSQKELTQLIEDINKLDTKYILIEQNTVSKATDLVLREVQATPLIIHNLSIRTSDEIIEDADYFQLMRENLQSLKTALQVH